jgi:hypothetical protein
MTNTDNTSITQRISFGRDSAVQTLVDHTQLMVKDRIRTLEAEAAAERLAATDRTRRTGLGLRALVGGSLIRAGHAIAPEPAQRGPAHRGHPYHRPSPMA